MCTKIYFIHYYYNNIYIFIEKPRFTAGVGGRQKPAVNLGPQLIRVSVFGVRNWQKKVGKAFNPYKGYF